MEWQKKLPDNNRGLCSHPDDKGRCILIKQDLDPEEELEVIIHEITHAGMWIVDEETVSRFAADLAQILTRLGWSKND